MKIVGESKTHKSQTRQMLINESGRKMQKAWISESEVPVPDALKGKEITILCRAVDSAYSTLAVNLVMSQGWLPGNCLVLGFFKRELEPRLVSI